MKFPRFAICSVLLLFSTSLLALDLRYENLTPDGWYILVESRQGDKYTVLVNTFIGAWKKDSKKITVPGGEIFVSIHKTKNIADNREPNRKKMKLKVKKGEFSFTITPGTNGEPKIRLF